ncbi:MAG: hypothetical protein U0487_00290 [Patescibacteria group bacterium]
MLLLNNDVIPASMQLMEESFIVHDIDGRQYGDREEMPLDGFARHMEKGLMSCTYMISMRFLLLIKDCTTAELMAAFQQHGAVPCSNLELEAFVRHYPYSTDDRSILSVGTVLLKDHRWPGVSRYDTVDGRLLQSWMRVYDNGTSDYYKNKLWSANLRFAVLTEHPVREAQRFYC